MDGYDLAVTVDVVLVIVALVFVVAVFGDGSFLLFMDRLDCSN